MCGAQLRCRARTRVSRRMHCRQLSLPGSQHGGPDAQPAAGAAAVQRQVEVVLRERFVRKPTNGDSSSKRWKMHPAGPQFCRLSRTHAGCKHGLKCWNLHVDENPG